MNHTNYYEKLIDFKKFCSQPDDELIDYLRTFLEYDDDISSVSSPRLGMLAIERSPSTIVSLIFSLCKYFKLSHRDRYLSSEIFDKFYTSHIMKSRREIMGFEEDEIEESCSDTKERMCQQLLLRIVSCIMIAFKVNTNNPRLTRKLEADCLQYLKLKHSSRNLQLIRKSVNRILEHLDYRVMFPITYQCLQVAVAALFSNIINQLSSTNGCPFNEDHLKRIRLFYPLAYEVLDAFYLKRKSLRSAVRNRWNTCNIRYAFHLLL